MSNEPAISKLPAVDRIQGVTVSPQQDPKASRVSVTYTGHNKRQYQLELGLMDALYLLNILEDACKRHGLDHLRHPPPVRRH